MNHFSLDTRPTNAQMPSAFASARNTYFITTPSGPEKSVRRRATSEGRGMETATWSVVWVVVGAEVTLPAAPPSRGVGQNLLRESAGAVTAPALSLGVS